jgi:hypothetical protein
MMDVDAVNNVMVYLSDPEEIINGEKLFFNTTEDKKAKFIAMIELAKLLQKESHLHFMMNAE